MADIVERLREVRGVLDNRWPGPTPMDLEAAEEIERLRTALELVRDWHDGDLDDGNWDKVISKVRAALVGGNTDG